MPNISILKNINKTAIINLGPQHPSAHGVLRLLLELDGEYVKRIDSHIGLLHRGTEKLLENRTYVQSIPYFSRLDYVGTMAQEHAYILAVEALINKKVRKKTLIIRVLFDEISRLLNHLLNITTQALDIGAITPFLIGFEEREKLMEFYEFVSGARLHTAFYRIGGVSQDIPLDLIEKIRSFLTIFVKRLLEIQNLLGENIIWKERLENVGILTKKQVLDFSCSGPMLRSSGISYDLRRIVPYSNYESFKFNIPIANNGDNYARYLIRMLEMFESVKIMHQALNKLENYILNEQKYKNIEDSKFTMENLIEHYFDYSKFFLIPTGELYRSIEAPKGEFGVYLIGDKNNKPARCKIRAPGFFHLQVLETMSKNAFLADLVANIGSLDLVLGEIDR